MSISVNPVTYAPPVSGVAAYSTRAANAYASYEEVLALQTENDLLEINQTSTTTSANDNVLLSSDLLNLSPAALNILNGVDSATGTDTTATGGLLPQQTLTPQQQQQAAAIVAQFANAPVTEQTFSQIESALTAAGINPSQLSVQQLFNYYAYAYLPGLAVNEQIITSTLTDDLLDA